MKVQDIISALEKTVPLSLQENYDNAGLITGNPGWECTGVLIALDTIEEVVQEAIKKNCNLIVSHHPVVFGALKKITGKNYVERTVIASIKNDIAIYAIHTNLDNLLSGVNGKIADKLGLVNRSVLLPKKNCLKKLITYIPLAAADNVRNAIFSAGGGHIGNYSECSFNGEGTGTFKAGMGTHPFVGKTGERHLEKEMKVEIVFPSWEEKKIINALLKSHPYEEPAYDILTLDNMYSQVGSGLVGELPVALSEDEFFQELRCVFHLQVIRHSGFLGKNVKKIALCGGAGSFLVRDSIAAAADVYVTSDMKYHEFFDAEHKLVIADIGHYESEQFCMELIIDILQKNFPNFAVLKTGVDTNPVHCFTAFKN